MRLARRKLMVGLLILAIAVGLGAGCTTYNPTTGQNEINYGATAGVAGAALGAAALGVALSNNDDDRHYYGGPGYYGGGGRGHNTVNVNKNVNVSNNKVNAKNRTNKSARVNKANRANTRAAGRPHRNK